MEVETGFVKIPGARLYYEVAGRGHPLRGHPLLLIHAGVADCRMWDVQFPVFAEQFRVVRYDTRGFGKSLTEDVSFSNRQDVSDLLDHLGIERTYVIGCHGADRSPSTSPWSIRSGWRRSFRSHQGWVVSRAVPALSKRRRCSQRWTGCGRQKSSHGWPIWRCGCG